MRESKANQILGDVVDQLKAVLSDLRDAGGKALWLFRSYFWVLWWGVSEPIRQRVKSSATFLLLIGGLHFCVELIATFLDFHVVKIHLPIWMKIGIVAFAVWVVVDRWREFKYSGRESVFAVTVASIFEEIAALDFADVAARDKSLDEFVEKVLVGFRKVFEEKLNVRMSVMLPVTRANVQKLKTVYYTPDNAKFQTDLELNPGEGAAGKAFQQATLIYIPAIRYLQGIKVTRGQQDRYSLESSAYVTINVQEFKSLICVPIGSSSRMLGVLNIDSSRTNAFGTSDFLVTYVAASAIAMVLDKYQSKSNNNSGG